jgi:N-methylhydantoinase B
MNDFGRPHPDLPPPAVLRAPYALREPPVAVDPVTYEILRHRIVYVGLTIGDTLKKVSGTIVTAEANDMSTYITLDDGAPVFLGPYVVLHSGIADLIISNVIRLNATDPGIRAGDMFFTNDPWLGPAHQPDCAIVAPLFVGDELFLWTGVTLHQLDMGGLSPGGLCPAARDAYAEPTLYPAIKIVEHGRLRADVDRLLRRNSRLPEILALDIRSMVAGNHAAQRDLLRLVEQYGPAVLQSVMMMMQQDASRRFRARLASLPHGRFRSRDWYEIGGSAPELQDEVYEVDCTLANTGEKLVFDFSGTAKQSSGFANCGIGGLRGGVLAGLLEQIAYDIPWNAGILVNIEILSQTGTTNNPTFPAAVSDGITEGAIATGVAAGGAVGNMILGDDHLRATTIGGAGSAFLGNTMGGLDRNGKLWGTLLMDAIGMAASGKEGRDGLDVCGSGGIPYTQYANVETNELHYPFLYLFRRRGARSFGHGYRRGGRALEYALKPHKTPFIYLLLWCHGAEFPNTAGIAGGMPPSAAVFRLARGTDVQARCARGEWPADAALFSWQALAAKSESYLGEDDIIYFGIPGGAGYGDPLRREAERVADDVAAGVIPMEQAREIYGVVLDAHSGEPNVTATEACRRERLRQRLDKSRWATEWPKLEPGSRPIGSPPLAKGAQGEAPLAVVLRLGLDLAVACDDRGACFWTCRGCGNVYCAAAENPKLRAKLAVEQLREAHPLAQMTRTETPRFFFRRFLCPGCGAQWATEVARAEDPILFSIEYDTGWLAALVRGAK